MTIVMLKNQRPTLSLFCITEGFIANCCRDTAYAEDSNKLLILTPITTKPQRGHWGEMIWEEKWHFIAFALSCKTFFIHSQKRREKFVFKKHSLHCSIATRNFTFTHKTFIHIHLQKHWENTSMTNIMRANAKFILGIQELRDWWFHSSLWAGFSQTTISCLGWQFWPKSDTI